MAEAKNTFIKSKMNKDLDARLMPNAEYRNAVNIQVSRSEGDGVGSLENVLGNDIIIPNGIEPTLTNLTAIGYFADEANSDIYIFLTDNDKTVYNPEAHHFVYKYNLNTTILEKLLEGVFLNFSKFNPIIGINLLENLLFWTDNRNQPRKINVTSAKEGTYYTTEETISVAKYNPYQPIELYQQSTVPAASGAYETTMKDVTNTFLPDGGEGIVKAGVNNASSFVVTDLVMPAYPSQPVSGKSVSYVDQNTQLIVPLGTIASNGWNAGSNTLTLTANVTIPVFTRIVFSPNPYFDGNYNGDPNFLQDKFVRFSYRFKFDDNEYSLMAPFTQICFIPQQDGYFINSTLTEGDEQQAYSSTIVDFMENKVNKIGLKIQLPSNGNQLRDINKITEIDILYKESNSLVVNVIESIAVADLQGLNSKVYDYEYQSKKPYKTLSPDVITRVFDKVPIKALSQEIISNRVVYGNFQNKKTPPASINYNVNASDKSSFDLNEGVGTVTSQPSSTTIALTTTSTSTIEVGSIVSGTGITTGTLVTAKTNSSTTPTITINNTATVSAGAVLSFSKSGKDVDRTSIIEYPSSSLKGNRNYQVGFVLADIFGRQSTVILSSNKNSVQVGANSFLGSTLFSSYHTEDPVTWPGDSLKVLVNDPITGELYNGDTTSLNYNPLGWYSYKIVVKQTEQEYYNVYNAGAIKGLPFNNVTNSPLPTLEKNKSFISLINDNINKVSRDLSEVGPQDKTFRSSVILYGRVENTDSVIANQQNKQYKTDRHFFTTSSVEDLYDLFDVLQFRASGSTDILVTSDKNAYFPFYKSDSNPFIAEIITSQSSYEQFGVVNNATIVEINAVLGAAVADSSEITVGSLVPATAIQVGSVVTWVNMPIYISPTVVIAIEPVSGSPGTFICTLNRNVTIANSVPQTNINFSSTGYSAVENLAIFETAPVESRLDIFWETSSAGLISDLNTLIRTEAGAGKNLSPFVTTNFTEAIGTNGNITNQPFNLVDDFGAIITTGITSFVITSVTQRGNDVSSYFNLVAAGTAYNVQVTQGISNSFLDNAYFGAAELEANSGYNFEFTSVVNGVTTVYLETVNLLNIQPAITAVTPPVGSGAEIQLQSAPNITNLMVATATNGANAALNVNKGTEINWSIVATANSNPLVPVSFFTPFVTDVVDGVGFKSQCQVKNSQAALSGGLGANSPVQVPGDTYKLILTAADGGQSPISLTYNLKLGITPVFNSVKQNTINYSDSSGNQYTETYVTLKIANQPDAQNWNGFYIYSVGSLNAYNDLTDNVVTVEINNQTATRTAGSCSNFSNWYFAPLSEAAVLALYISCLNPAPASTPVPTVGASIPQSGTPFWSVVN